MNKTEYSIANIREEKYLTRLHNGRHSATADETREHGGSGEGFTPTELLCSSLAACTVITLRMYTDHKQLQIGEIEAEVHFHPAEGEEPAFFSRSIRLGADPGPEIRERLLAVAGKCPMAKILSASHAIQSQIS